jgi:DNA-binding PadR family transcriptional regulator
MVTCVRRKRGTELTRNELKVLAAALRLHFEDEHQLYGYELFATLSEWEGGEPMNHGTLYRCLRSLEGLGLLSSTVDDSSARHRVFYQLTAPGLTAARRSTIQLAALYQPPPWIDLGAAIAPTSLPEDL